MRVDMYLYSNTIFMHNPRVYALHVCMYRWGKLPITIYPKNYTSAMDAADAGIANYEFAKGLGRSHRYYTEKPLYPFGFGLSYTTFAHTCTQQASKQSDSGLSFMCIIENTGTVAGDEVLLVYHSVGDQIRKTIGDAHPVPFKDLCEFTRVSLPAGKKVQVEFTLDTQQAATITTQDGSQKLYPGQHAFIFSRGQPEHDQVITVDL